MCDDIIDITFFEQAELDLICWYWPHLLFWAENMSIADQITLYTKKELRQAGFIMRLHAELN